MCHLFWWTAENHDTLCFDIKQLNWDSFLESGVKVVRQYILKDDLSTLLPVRSGQ
jgi:hypothetical protein